MNSLFDFDRQKIRTYKYLIGTDEAGRGPGAGPVCSAAVCFKEVPSKLIKMLKDLDDSKKLSEKTREGLFDCIVQNSTFAIDFATVEEIEKINILQASLLSMKRACTQVMQQLDSKEIMLLIDGNKLIPKFDLSQEFIIKGDSKSASIAAASILAKVSRDRLMKELDFEFPQYNWKKNKGYLTKEHLDAIDEFGICKWHRKKFLQKHFEKPKQTQLELNLK